MNNKERVLAYYNKWANKATNPVNGVRVVQEGKTLESFGVVVVMDGLGCQFRHNPWHYNYDDVFWDRLVLLLRLDQPAAAVPSKEADYWKSYAKQTRGEKTKVEQELADLKAAYNGLCEVHAELAGKHIFPAPSFVAECIAHQLYQYLEETTYDYHYTIGQGVMERHIRAAFNIAKDRYLEITKREYEAVPE